MLLIQTPSLLSPLAVYLLQLRLCIILCNDGLRPITLCDQYVIYPEYLETPNFMLSALLLGQFTAHFSAPEAMLAFMVKQWIAHHLSHLLNEQHRLYCVQ